MKRSDVMFPRTVFTVLVFSLLLGAADPSAYIVRGWQNRMAESSRLLKAGDYAAALRITNRVANDMVERLGPGQESTEVFGIVLVHRALAYAGAGNTEEALWYWYSATSLFPKILESDISMFGSAAAFLKQHTAPDYEGLAFIGMPDVQSPKLLKRIEPSFPRGAYAFGTGGTLIVQVIIDETGRVKSPRILKSLPAPTLSYAALEALKRWRFEPARVDGNPISVKFNLTVNYKFP